MYVTADAMIAKFGEREIIQLTDNEAPYQDVINHDKLNAAIEEANSEIDGWLQGHRHRKCFRGSEAFSWRFRK